MTEKIEVELNQEDVQSIIDCYEKDIKYIKKLKQEKQELIDYLKSEIQNWKDKIFENSLTEDNFTLALWRSRLITYEKVLNKIEKR